MRGWIGRWKKELDSAIPPLRDDILSEEIQGAERNDNPRVRRKPLIYGLSSIGALAACVLIAVAVIFGYTPPENDSFTVSAVTVEINPGVTFATDENGLISNIIALNADADVLLSGGELKEILIGKPMNNALTLWVEYAARAGFIDLDQPDVIRISATGDCKKEWLSLSASEIEAFFDSHNIGTLVISELIDVESFSERFGIDNIDGEDSLSLWINNSVGSFTEREAQLLSGDELESIYRDRFVDKIFKDEITSSINSYVSDILYINELNLGIVNAAFTDYFGMKENGIPIYAPDKEEAARLASEMEAALSRFADSYGKVISSSAELAEVSMDPAAILSDFLLMWGNSITDAINMIEENGISVGAAIRDLIDAAPRDMESFTAAAREAYSINLDAMLNANKSSYEKEREDVDIAKIEEAVIREYGSLSAFFEEKNR